MPHPRPTRTARRRAAVLVPLAALSAVWTADLAATGPVVVSAVAGPVGGLPDGSSVPARTIEAPASVSVAEHHLTGSVAGPGGDATRIVATSSTNGIPAAALAAYQRAETVINAADRACNLEWQLVAAIGRVESDHGRVDGSVLDAAGVARPGIRGIALTGRNDTVLVRDTDAGQYDADTRFDRAVGPMQFIPSTWSVVGVDADDDGVRNPQDVDDAALAAAVYLCSGSHDLATSTGRRASVLRYNHSQSYVDLVLAVADAYLQGDFMSVPDGTVAAGFLSPDPGYDPGPAAGPAADDTVRGTRPSEPTGGSAASPGSDPGSDPGSSPDGGPEERSPRSPRPLVTVPVVPGTGVGAVDEVLTRARAIVQCTLDGHVEDLLRSDDDHDVCVGAYTAGTSRQP